MVREITLDPRQVDILTDATERTGATVMRAAIEGERIVIEGTLAKIEGARGPVGFAIARFPLDGPLPSDFAGLEVTARSEPPLAWSVGLAVDKDRQLDRSLIADWTAALPVGAAEGPLRLEAGAFAPQARGRAAAGPPLAAVLDRILFVDFRILRSRQAPALRDGGALPFRLLIGRALRLF